MLPHRPVSLDLGAFFDNCAHAVAAAEIGFGSVFHCVCNANSLVFCRQVPILAILNFSTFGFPPRLVSLSLDRQLPLADFF